MPYYDIATLAVGRAPHYTYRSAESLQPGEIVRVPYGKRTVVGVVLGEANSRPQGMKEVAERPGIRLGKHQRSLAAWVAEEYLTPLGLTYKSFVTEDILKYAPDPVPRAPSTPPGTPASELLIGTDRSSRYRDLVTEANRAGKSALMLVPETSLVSRAVELLGDAETLAFHSRLTPKQRALIWWKVFSGEPRVLVGTRSSLFLPWINLGVIILDEEDDAAYKQEQAPRYQARAVASRLAELSGGRMEFGSLAPSMEIWRRAKSGTLTVTGKSGSIPFTTAAPDSKRVIGFEAWSLVSERLAQNGQALLYAPARNLPSVLAAARELSPKTLPLHGDGRATDDRAVEAFRAGRCPVLVGGAPLARDWCLSADAIVCVGIDLLLQLPDFRAAEKAHALLRKLARHLTTGGRLLIQTEAADHPAVAGLRNAWEAFADAELADRKALRLPPFARLTRVVVTGRTDAEAAANVSAAVRHLAEFGISPSSTGPAPVNPRGSRYRHQLLIPGDPKRLSRAVRREWAVDPDPWDML